MSRQYKKLPSEILEEDLIWINRMRELDYHLNRQEVDI